MRYLTLALTTALIIAGVTVDPYTDPASTSDPASGPSPYTNSIPGSLGACYVVPRVLAEAH